MPRVAATVDGFAMPVNGGRAAGALPNAPRAVRRTPLPARVFAEIVPHMKGAQAVRMNGRSLRCLVVAALVAGTAPSPAPARHLGDKDSIVTLQFENDFFGNSDGQFSHGTRIAWMSPEDLVPDWAKALADWVPRFDIALSKRIVYSLGQSMFTPSDISRRELIPDDRPYAGWLYAGFGLVSVGADFLDNLELNIGVVGPWSFAEETQKRWHELFNFRRPEGWDNQLENEPGIQLNFERKWRAWESFSIETLGGDITPHIGVGLGNILTHGAVGVTLRLGEDLPNDYGPPRIRPSLPGSDYFVSRGGFSWYLFVGAEGRAVGHNIFLDGNTFRDSHSVDKQNFVADFQAGIVFFIGGARIAYTHVLRTEEFENQDGPVQFGALSASFRF